MDGWGSWWTWEMVDFAVDISFIYLFFLSFFWNDVRKMFSGYAIVFGWINSNDLCSNVQFKQRLKKNKNTENK